jgi:DNA-binding CsgD family transcriptional regulator
MQPREQLTAKEAQVSLLVWEGLTNREIAQRLHTTEQVVKNYLRNTFDKLGVWSRLELAIYVAGHGGSKWADQMGFREQSAVMPEASQNGSTSHSGHLPLPSLGVSEGREV